MEIGEIGEIIMSKLHEMKIKHRGMSAAEKISCNCEICKGLNVHKSKRKIQTESISSIEPNKV